MKTILMLLLIFTCGFSAGILLYSECPEPQIDDNVFFNELAQRFADNHAYSKDMYDCNNYSNDFAFIANSLGFELYKLDNLDTCHSYNLVAFEPQRAKVVTYKDNKTTCEDLK